MALDTFSVLRRFVLEGPNDNDGAIGWLFGMWLWWRMWGFILLLGVPLVLGAYVHANSDGAAGVLVTWIASVFVVPTAMKVSPKYEVTENY